MKYERCVTALAIVALGCSEQTAPQVQQSQLGFEEVSNQIGVHAAFDDDGDAQKRRAARLAALPAELAQIADTAGGVTAGDIDGDADVDLVVLTASGHAQVLTNPLDLGGASWEFVDESERAGLAIDSLAHSPMLVDLVGDEKPDLLVGSFGETGLALYENRWPEGFVDVTEDVGLNTSLSTSGLAVADVDNDGDLDSFVSYWRAVPSEIDPGTSEASEGANVNAASPVGLFWVNDARSGFSPRAEVLVPLDPVSGLTRALSPSFADIDADGDADLLLAGEPGVTLWVNSWRVLDTAEPDVPEAIAPEADAGATTDGGIPLSRPAVEPGTLQFVQAEHPSQVSGRGMALGDYDLDGDPDWFVSGGFGEAPRGAFLRNDGAVQQRFKATAENGSSARGFGSSACFEDFDNDGLLDIFQTADANYHPGFDAEGQALGVSSSKDSRAALYLGRLEPAGSFTDAASDFGLDQVKHGRGALCFDYDKDGDVDLFVTAVGEPLRVFRNKLNPGVGTGANSLGVRLSFRVGNPAGIGARITAVTHGVSQTREVRHAGGTFGSGAPVVLFGFAAEELIDELTVTWPNSEVSVKTDVFLSDVLAIRYLGEE